MLVNCLNGLYVANDPRDYGWKGDDGKFKVCNINITYSTLHKHVLYQYTISLKEESNAEENFREETNSRNLGN